MLLSQQQALIVEDMDVMRKILVEQLRKMGFGQVYQAENGRRAQELLDELSVDIVLMDWNMPNGDGADLLKEIRQQAKWQHLAVILVTANTHRGMIQEAIKYGVIDIIAKPFTTKTLQDRVLQALRVEPHSLSLESAIESQAFVTANPIAETTSEPLQNTVLIVDDTADNLAFMVGLLRDTYKVLFAKDGQTALNICQSESAPDLVLLDIMMPDMDGFQVLKALREHPLSESIPVIFVSALHEATYQVQGLRGGAIDYLVKPVQPEILTLRVANLLTTVNLQRGLQANYDNMLALSRLKDSVDELIHHDLKSPLAAISAMLQRLSQDKNCPKDWRAKLNAINALTMQSINTVNLSSEIFKIETGRFTLTPERFSAHGLVKHVLHTMHVTFHHKQLIAFQFPDDDPKAEFDVLADSTLTYSILLNLIKNAFEAAKVRTKVAVYLSVEQDNVLIKIENFGVVPENIRSRFWDKYVTSQKVKGVGLGTYSARLLANAQGGTTQLHVDDQQDKTIVTVRLPAAT
ncbi:MAG: ATP-binding response regulator [Shewanella sp.]